MTTARALPQRAPTQVKRKRGVFIAHGRTPLWPRVALEIQRLGAKPIYYEMTGRGGEEVSDVLRDMVRRSGFAVVLFTGENEMTDGSRHPRDNVIHELGLCQGLLGPGKTLVLLQEGTILPANISGTQYVQFHGDSVEATFYELQHALRREGVIK